jgi:hypothetical protein
MMDEHCDVPERNCDDCGRAYEGDVRQAPMLLDGSWRKLAHRREHLCSECLRARAKIRGIEITLADLRPCPFNIGAGWFEKFADKAPPEVVMTWLKWARRAQESNDARHEQFHNAADRIFGDGRANPEGRLYRLTRKIFRRGGAQQ